MKSWLLVLLILYPVGMSSFSATSPCISPPLEFGLTRPRLGLCLSFYFLPIFGHENPQAYPKCSLFHEMFPNPWDRINLSFLHSSWISSRGLNRSSPGMLICIYSCLLFLQKALTVEIASHSPLLTFLAHTRLGAQQRVLNWIELRSASPLH